MSQNCSSSWFKYSRKSKERLWPWRKIFYFYFSFNKKQAACVKGPQPSWTNQVLHFTLPLFRGVGQKTVWTELIPLLTAAGSLRAQGGSWSSFFIVSVDKRTENKCFTQRDLTSHWYHEPWTCLSVTDNLLITFPARSVHRPSHRSPRTAQTGCDTRWAAALEGSVRKIRCYATSLSFRLKRAHRKYLLGWAASFNWL